MIAEKILKRKPVTLAEAKDLVKERLKTVDAPTYEQDMTMQYVDKFAKLTKAKAEKLTEDLQKIEGVDHWLAAKIADLLPQEKPVLELLLTKKYKLSEESTQSILETVKKFVK